LVRGLKLIILCYSKTFEKCTQKLHRKSQKSMDNRGGGTYLGVGLVLVDVLNVSDDPLAPEEQNTILRGSFTN
jgi:hypothetical protein